MPTQWLRFGSCALEKASYSLSMQKSCSWSDWGIPGGKKSGTAPGATSKCCKSRVKGIKLWLGPLDVRCMVKHCKTWRWSAILSDSWTVVPSPPKCSILWANKYILEEPGGYGLLDISLLYISLFWHTGAWLEKQLTIKVRTQEREVCSQLHHWVCLGLSFSYVIANCWGWHKCFSLR